MGATTGDISTTLISTTRSPRSPPSCPGTSLTLTPKRSETWTPETAARTTTTIKSCITGSGMSAGWRRGFRWRLPSMNCASGIASNVHGCVGSLSFTNIGIYSAVEQLIPGRWAGLQAVVVGSNSRRRKRAARIALAIAAVHEARSLRVLIE